MMAELFYHATTAQHLRSIRKRGLRADGGKRQNFTSDSYAHTRFGVYLFGTLAPALTWAKVRVARSHPYARLYVVELVLDMDADGPIWPDCHSDNMVQGVAFFTPKPVPAHHISRVGEVVWGSR